MTEKEAIRILGDTTICSPLGQAAFKAIECIKELQQYREIGTVEERQEAAEKQKAKKCVIDSCPDHTYYKCHSLSIADRLLMRIWREWKMSEIKLKPCPICGRTDVYSEFKHIGKNCMTEIYDLRIRCNNPDCGLEKHHKIELDDESFDIVLKEIEFAVNDWNRRAGEQNE